MARGFSASGGGSTWRSAQKLWASQGGTWRPVKVVWAAQGGQWKPVWPPGFTSFSVVASSGEVGLTSSSVSWDITPSEAGTVTIQRKAPGGSYTDVLTGQATAGSTTLNPLAPTQGAAGTWYFRAVFIPTANPSSPVYSAEDSATLSIPVVALSVTSSSGEVHYTSSYMSWSVSGSLAGTVKLQRKLGAGAWADFATGLAKTSGATYQLAPAGPANNGTWYYRAVFVPTADPAWSLLSSESSATLTYRAKGTAPSVVNLNSGTFEDDEGDWSLPWGDPQSVTTPLGIVYDHVNYWQGAGGGYWNVTNVAVTVNGADGYYVWYGGDPPLLYQYAQDVTGAISFSTGASTSYGYFKDTLNRTVASVVGGWRSFPVPSPIYTPTWGVGFNLLGCDGGTAVFTWVDGQQISVPVSPKPFN